MHGNGTRKISELGKEVFVKAFCDNTAVVIYQFIEKYHHKYSTMGAADSARSAADNKESSSLLIY